MPAEASRWISSASPSVSAEKSPTWRFGATSRWPDEYGDRLRTTIACSPRATTSSPAPAAARQRKQPSSSSAVWMYSSRHGAHRCSTTRLLPERRRARSPAPFGRVRCCWCLAGRGSRVDDDVARRALLVGDRVADGRGEAVRRGRRRLDRDALDALVVGRLQVREGHAGIAVVVRVVRLDGRDRRAYVGLGRAVVRAILELQVGRDGDREQDAEDDDDDQHFDEGETALILGQ